MLVRMKPFKEWIYVYYDPEKTSEAKLLKTLHENRCASATADQFVKDDITVLNPFLSAGEIVQLRITGVPKGKALDASLPDDWKVVGDSKGFSGKDGKTYLSIKVTPKVAQKKYKVGVKISDDKSLEAVIEVVRKI
ncbi:MAG: hypothetical protein QNL01_02110 [Akkermansiaceae bacterium]|jgi:hypothetical protein|tara:strand:- start:667 stop:1074 length:408 start_codon:yes stop_codon:yes gene_type:complete